MYMQNLLSEAIKRLPLSSFSYIDDTLNVDAHGALRANITYSKGVYDVKLIRPQGNNNYGTSSTSVAVDYLENMLSFAHLAERDSLPALADEYMRKVLRFKCTETVLHNGENVNTKDLNLFTKLLRDKRKFMMDTAHLRYKLEERGLSLVGHESAMTYLWVLSLHCLRMPLSERKALEPSNLGDDEGEATDVLNDLHNTTASWLRNTRDVWFDTITHKGA